MRMHIWIYNLIVEKHELSKKNKFKQEVQIKEENQKNLIWKKVNAFVRKTTLLEKHTWMLVQADLIYLMYDKIEAYLQSAV